VVFIFNLVLLKNCKPINPSLRFRSIINKKSLNLIKFKRLFFKKKNNSGRNNFGHITVRHKGSGLFNLRRSVDFFRLNTEDSFFISYDIDKKFSSFLGLIKYKSGLISYILAPNNLTEFLKLKTTFFTKKTDLGFVSPIGWMQPGSLIFNLESKPNSGGKLIRAAGTFGRIINNNNNRILVKLPSKKNIYFSKFCLATIGRASNILHFLKILGKAGISRYLNIRPTVRGETMNPIDHPNGGRTRGGKPRRNPWGKIIK